MKIEVALLFCLIIIHAACAPSSPVSKNARESGSSLRKENPAGTFPFVNREHLNGVGTPVSGMSMIHKHFKNLYNTLSHHADVLNTEQIGTSLLKQARVIIAVSTIPHCALCAITRSLNTTAISHSSSPMVPNHQLSRARQCCCCPGRGASAALTRSLA